jgi:hypothetical protein
MVNCSRDKTNKTNFGEKLSNSIDTMARLSSVTLFADCVFLRLKSKAPKKNYQLPIPHLMDEIVQTRITAGYDSQPNHVAIRQRATGNVGSA